MEERRATITVIEDEQAILDVVIYNLERAGYDVASARDGADGLALIEQSPPDLVVLDLMLPGIDGMEVCRRLRQGDTTRGIAVLMLTALDDEGDIVAGFEAGADDYLAKPFSPRELVARVGAIIRRSDGQRSDEGPTESVSVLQLAGGAVVIDPHRFTVEIDSETIAFTRTELRVLAALAAAPERALTREQIVVRAIGDDAWVTERTIDVHVRAIRRKLASYAHLVETVRGVGYRIRTEET